MIMLQRIPRMNIWMLVNNDQEWNEHLEICKRKTHFNKHLDMGTAPELLPCLVYSYFDIVSNQWIHIFVYQQDAEKLVKSKMHRLASTLNVYRNHKNWDDNKWKGCGNPMSLAQQAINDTGTNKLAITKNI